MAFPANLLLCVFGVAGRIANGDNAEAVSGSHGLPVVDPKTYPPYLKVLEQGMYDAIHRYRNKKRCVRLAVAALLLMALSSQATAVCLPVLLSRYWVLVFQLGCLCPVCQQHFCLHACWFAMLATVVLTCSLLLCWATVGLRRTTP